MLASLSNLFMWTTTSTVQDNWNTWEVWQRDQPSAHYEKCDIFQYYLKQRPQFQPPEYNATVNNNNKAYSYCFGDFTPLVITEGGCGACDIITYCNLLLDIYDVCKGLTRRIKGDPSGILLIREVVIKRNLTSFYKRDFNKYCYDYSILHAHTVAQYSLSTLIMRLLTNYLYHACSRKYFPNIQSDLCIKSYRKLVFGNHRELPTDNNFTKPLAASMTLPITIKSNFTPNQENKNSSSWPMNINSCLRCESCKRVTENRWGPFNACLDCHMKRICSVCGITSVVIISSDKLPKCLSHCDLFPISSEESQPDM